MEAPGGSRHPVELSSMRLAVGRRMVDSKQHIPHFYVSADVVMDGLLDGLAVHNAEREVSERISVTAALVHATALSLQAHPQFNAIWDGTVLQRVDEVNVGVAIELRDGLLAPAVLNCESLDVYATAAALRDLVARARAGRVRAAEWAGATFTLSNLGAFAVDSFSAIVVPPQVAILATARTRTTVGASGDGTGHVRRVMTATLSADHRAVDGVDAARFLTTLNERLGEAQTWFTPTT